MKTIQELGLRVAIPSGEAGRVHYALPIGEGKRPTYVALCARDPEHPIEEPDLKFHRITDELPKGRLVCQICHELACAASLGRRRTIKDGYICRVAVAHGG